MQSLNSVILIGRVGKDPETKDINGKKVTTFSLATDYQSKDQVGAKQTETEWHDITVWGKEKLLPFIKKGSPLWINGHLKTSEWKQKVGEQDVNRSRTSVVAEEIGLLDSKE